MGLKVWQILITSILASGPILASESMPPIQSVATKEWSYTLALQAATWGAPLVSMYALRYNDALGPNPKAVPNTIWRVEDIVSPALSKEARYVTPDVNVLYGFGFMDLRDEPIVLEVPDSNNRYYMVEIVDMWTNAFAYAGGKTTGYKGGKFLLAGPSWHGEPILGMLQIDCPTPWVLLQPRVHIYDNGKIDLQGAKKILSSIKTMRLSEYLGKPTPPKPSLDYPSPASLDTTLPVSALSFTDPLQFWEILSNALNENPPPKDQITALLPLFQLLGIELNKKWDRTLIKNEILDAMGNAAKKIGPLLASLPYGTTYHGALIPPPTIGNAQNDYYTRAVLARIGLTFNIPKEAVYWMYNDDSQRNPLNGTQKYTMTFKEGIPFYAPGFWSITLYDADTNYPISNPINRYMLGSDTTSLTKNEDGSFTIYIQNDSPGKDKESNWLPAPAGAFYIMARSFAPKPVTMRILSDVTAWDIPTIEPAK